MPQPNVLDTRLEYLEAQANQDSGHAQQLAQLAQEEVHRYRQIITQYLPQTITAFRDVIWPWWQEFSTSYLPRIAPFYNFNKARPFRLSTSTVHFWPRSSFTWLDSPRTNKSTTNLKTDETWRGYFGARLANSVPQLVIAYWPDQNRGSLAFSYLARQLELLVDPSGDFLDLVHPQITLDFAAQIDSKEVYLTATKNI